MTYSITFLCSTGGADPGQILESAICAARQDGPQLAIVEQTNGDDWTESGIIAVDGVADPSAIRLEVRGPSKLTVDVVSQYAEEAEAGRLDSVDSVATLTLSGEDIDWRIVKKLWQAFESQWSAIPYDETSGFETSIAALG
jgi:hypothetical protein